MYAFKTIAIAFFKVCSAEEYNYWIKKCRECEKNGLLKLEKMCSLSSQKTIK